MSKAHEIIKCGLSLVGFFKRYPTAVEAEAQFEAWRWPNGPICPHCDSTNVSVVQSRRPQPYRCRTCRRHFSFKTDTPMHDSKLDAHTWLLGLFLIVANPKGRSSVQLAADLGITQKSAWHLSHRIRRALTDGSLPGFEGPVEVDETYIGGKAANMHNSVRRRRILGTGGSAGKEMVLGIRDRHSGSVTAQHIDHRQTAASIIPTVAKQTQSGAEVFTDGDTRYLPLHRWGFRHESVSHKAGEYVRGRVSTNGIENYWSHLKRTYIGTYHWWSPEHLDRYLAEHTFRFNRRDCHVTDRMADAAANMNGQRLPWAELVADGHWANRDRMQPEPVVK